MVEHGFLSRRSAGAKRAGQNIFPWFVALAVLMLIAFSALQPVAAGAGTQHDSGSLVAQTAQEPATSDSLSVADVAERATSAVVTIYTFADAPSPGDGAQPADPGSSLKPGESPGAEPVPLGAGSGWIFSEDGYVVTNAHVVQGAGSYVVQYADGTQVEADLVGVDTFQDVAVLKLRLDEGETVPGVATIGDSSSVRAGDEVVAIGSPLGEFTNTVSNGFIGGLDRSLEIGNGLALENLIQHDAEISPGNSGGPLLNMRGEVIGMNVAKVETAATGGPSVSGLNFAIDGDTVVEIVREIIDNGGSIEHPYLGVQTQLAGPGLVVVGVEPGSPAANAGIVEGDILAGIDGVRADQERSFLQLLLDEDAGATIQVTIERNGSTMDVAVTLGTRPDGI